VESDVDIGITFTLRFKIEFDHIPREELVEETNPNSLQKTSTNGIHENGLPESEEDHI
jgi:hypothetical protein